MSDKKELAIIAIKTTAIKIDADFDKAEKQLNAELEKYSNVLVTEETLAADKKLGQELSSKAKLYDAERKRMVNELSAPIAEFGENMKKLGALCVQASKKISDQVKVFELEKLERVKAAIAEFIASERVRLEVQEEFQTTGSDHLAKITCFTPKGALNKGTKDKITAIVQSELALQQKIEMRLMQLENESYKAGLHSPLVKMNVEAFLFADDDTYARNLERIVQSELDRQKATEAKLKAKAEADALAKLKEENRIKAAALAEENAKKKGAMDAETKEAPATAKENGNELAGNGTVQNPEEVKARLDQRFKEVNKKPEPKPEQQATQQSAAPMKNGNVPYSIEAIFDISVPAHVPEAAIRQKLKSMLIAAGFKSMTSIKVTKNV